jgi:hypothetical protein
VHDARIVRFLSVDPLAPDYPHNSPYAFSENRVIDAIELEGLESVTLSDETVIETGPVPKEKQFEQVEKAGYSLDQVTGFSDGTIMLPPAEVLEYANETTNNSSASPRISSEGEELSSTTEPWEPSKQPNPILVRELGLNLYFGGGASFSLIRVGNGTYDE